MLNQVHYNRALYAAVPKPGSRFKQIVVVEKEDRYEVRVFDGEVLRNDEEFAADNDVAALEINPTLSGARKEAEAILGEALGEGWLVYGT